jgi:hypothetical protein
MPVIRKKSNLKHFILNASEKRRFDDVIECLKYVEFSRDKDDLLTKGAGKLAEDLAAMADAMAKPLAKRAESGK